MKIKSVSFLLVVMLMIALVSGGVMAAEPFTHNLKDGIVTIDNSCGEECPGHVITGPAESSENNIRILSGDHKIILRDLWTHSSYPHEMTDEKIQEYSGLYIADEVGNVELTIEGKVAFSNVYGLYCAADALTILGDDTSDLSFSGKYEGAYVKNALTIKGGFVYFGTAAFSPDGSGNHYRYHLRGLVAEGTVTLEDAMVQAYAGNFGGAMYAGDEGGIASAAIEANTLIMKNSHVNAESGDVACEEGKNPKSIAIDAVNLNVVSSNITATGGESYDSYGIRVADSAEIKGSNVEAIGSTAENESIGFEVTNLDVETNDMDRSNITATGGASYDSYGIRVGDSAEIKDSYVKATGGTAENESIGFEAENLDVNNTIVDDLEFTAIGGDSYNSYGIRLTEYSNFANCDVVAIGGTADNMSIGLDAIDATVVGVYSNAFLDLTGGTSGYISIGGDINHIEVSDSRVYGYGGEAKRYSAGLSGGTLSADSSDVRGFGGVATDTNVVDGEGVFSEGLFFITIDGTDSDIYGLGEKAMISNGISTTEITVKGGLLEGMGSDECKGADAGEYSHGIYMEPAKTDEGTSVPVKFEIIGGDVIAEGKTVGLYVDEENFEVSYKADENAEAETKSDFTEDEKFLFGNKYKVSYNDGGVGAENMPADTAYYNGEEFLLPKEIPAVKDYEFLGWRNQDGTFFKAEDYNCISVSGEDMVFTAEWKCLGGKDCPLRDFKDLDPQKWYHDGIEYCLAIEVMKGTGKDTFEPATAATRAMIVTTLYRMAVEPEVEGDVVFSDVKEGTWYTDAVIWATENGIAKGLPDGTFAPNKPATREELAVFMYRFAEYSHLNIDREPLPDTFTDKGTISGWALPAMEWAVGTSHIIKGVDETTLSPKTHADRAQLAAMIGRLNDFFLSEFEY